MNHTLTYVIRAFDEKLGQISVEVTCAEHGETQIFAIDLPINESGTYPVGGELEALIAERAPVWHFERMDKAATVTNIEAIKALVVPYPEPEPVIDPNAISDPTPVESVPQ